MNRDKYLNQKDCTELRERLAADQNGLDPITLKPLDKPCIDHDHFDGSIRGVLSNQTNKWEGFTLKAYVKHMGGYAALPEYLNCLKRLVAYLEEDAKSEKLHHTHRKVEVREFKKMCSTAQAQYLLKALNAKSPLPKNEKGRVELFKELMGH